MPKEIVFLSVLLLLGILGKNQPIIIAVLILMAVRLVGMKEKIMPAFEKYGVDIGITLILLAVLTPIASGEVNLTELFTALKSPSGIIALIAGALVALIASEGIQLLKGMPEVTTFLVIGTILAVVFFKGIPVGPLIGAGVAMIMIRIFDWVRAIL